MNEQLTLIKTSCPVFGNAHRWIFDTPNGSVSRGRCKCGAETQGLNAMPDRTTRKQLFANGITMAQNFTTNGGFYIQGSLPDRTNDTSFNPRLNKWTDKVNSFYNDEG